MPNDFIVAIELGSSKMTGIAGKNNIDGSITVHAIVEEDSSACIRKGVVYNLDKTGQCLTNIIQRLKTILKHEITQVYVGVGGQSIRSVKNVIIKDFPDGTRISQDMVNEIMDINRAMTYPEQEILDSAVQEYRVDAQYQLDPVGIQCNHLEGNFLNILWRKSFYHHINTCFEMAGIPIAEMYLAPLALADSVLTDAEKRMGCLLVDLGADTTTVCVYHKNILRHLAVIPLGSNNINKDLVNTFQLDDSEAEEMKLKYASAYTDNSSIENMPNYVIDQERQMESRKFIELVEGRLAEIIQNAWFQVPSEYADKLGGGIVLTGGGSNMPEIQKAFQQHTHIEKIRIAKFISQSVNSNDQKVTEQKGMMNTILGLLAKGNMNCAGEEIRNDLFDSNNNSKPVRNPNDTNKVGVVLTAAEKQKAEEEAKKKREEEELARQKAAAEEARRLEEERRQNSFIHKMGRRIKQFGKKMIEPEE